MAEVISMVRVYRIGRRRIRWDIELVHLKNANQMSCCINASVVGKLDN